MLIVLLTLLVTILPGCGETKPAAPLNEVKIELTAPKFDKDKKLTLVPGAEFFVTVRIRNLEKTLYPDVVFARFIRSKDKAQAGDFLARPRQIDGTEMEYSTKVIAPKGPGNYKLIVVPSPHSEAIPGAPPKEKYPSLEITVK